MAPATETRTHTVSAALLKAFTQAILEAAGASPTNAEIVAAGQVDAHLTGHESHGVIRIPGLVRDCQSGKLKPANTPAVVREGAATAVVDGASTFGHVGCKLATEIAIRKARQGTLGAVSLTRANHTGRMGEWTELGAAQGLITMVAGSRVNSSRGQVGGLLAPHGGRTGALGTSPISWAVPRAGGAPPILLDYATSAVAGGKLQVARAKGESVPLGWIIDSEGRPTTDVEDFFNGGAQLPFAGHKGYAMAVIVTLLSIGLSEGDLLDPSEHGSCLFVLCIDPAAFRPADEFARMVEDTCARLKAVPPAEGFAEVLLPGEPEARSRAERLEHGIPIPIPIWDDLCATARGLGVPVR
jgi:hydroxycarboxylate dehydrogenase B